MSHHAPVQIPVSPHRWAVLAAPWPLSPAEWDQLLVTLVAMRPGLVADAEVVPADAGSPESDGGNR